MFRLECPEESSLVLCFDDPALWREVFWLLPRANEKHLIHS